MGLFKKRETDRDDADRTNRLLDGLETAFATRTGGDDYAPLDDFESVILFGMGYGPSGEYPPPGHDYPSR